MIKTHFQSFLHKTFKYNTIVGGEINNYNHLAKELISNDNTHRLCNEIKYNDYVDNIHGYIITNDLDILENHCLKNFMYYATTFRITIRLLIFPKNVNWMY